MLLGLGAGIKVFRVAVERSLRLPEEIDSL